MEEVGTRNLPIFETSKLVDAKKVFIEKWLMSFVRGCEEEKIFDMAFPEKSQGTTRSQQGTATHLSSKSEQLNFWNLDTLKNEKKHTPKLLTALKNMFKKKKGEFVKESDSYKEETETEQDSWRTSGTELVIGNVMQPPLGTFLQKKCVPKINRDSLNMFQPENTILNLDKDLGKAPIIIYQTKYPSRMIKSRVDNLDPLYRGYSEVLQNKNISEVQGSTSSLNDTSGTEMNWTTPYTGAEESWKIVENWAKVKRVFSTDSELVHHRRENRRRKDSYLEKIELLKKRIEEKRKSSTEIEDDTTDYKNSIIEVKSLDTSSDKLLTQKESTGEYSALTKDLTGAKYLNEHDRLQWEGRNKETWFRFSTLIKRSKYAETADIAEPMTLKINSKSSLSLQSYLQNKEHMRNHQYPPPATVRRRSTQKPLKVQTTPSSCVITKKVNGQRKLEDFFTKDQLKSKAYPIPVSLPYYRERLTQRIDEVNCRTQLWHATINRVRETMKTIERPKGGQDPMRNFGYKGRLKTCTMGSSGDKDEVTTTTRSLSEGVSTTSHKSKYSRFTDMPFNKRFKIKDC